MPDTILPHCTLAACNSPFAYCVGWSVGCYLIRWQINTAWSSSIKEVPYRTVFGQYPRVGISALPLASTVVDSLKTEAELNQALGLGGTDDCASVLTKPVMEEVRLLQMYDYSMNSCMYHHQPHHHHHRPPLRSLPHIGGTPHHERAVDK